MIAHLDTTFKPSPLRRMFCSLFFVAVAIAALGAIGSSRGAGAAANKIEPWVIEHTANGQQAELMVVLVDQADLRPAIPAGFEVAGLADFDGNERPDYLLYNSSIRQTAIWYLNNYLLIGNAAGPTIWNGWSVVAP